MPLKVDDMDEARAIVRALGVSGISAERLVQAAAEVSRPDALIVRLRAALELVNTRGPGDGVDGNG